MLVKNIRPDGVLLFNDTLYFLEMDMNTERAARLQKNGGAIDILHRPQNTHISSMI